MIKSILGISIFSGICAMIFGLPELFTLVLKFKGTFIWILSLMYSRLAVFCCLAFIMYEVIHKFFKKI